MEREFTMDCGDRRASRRASSAGSSDANTPASLGERQLVGGRDRDRLSKPAVLGGNDLGELGGFDACFGVRGERDVKRGTLVTVREAADAESTDEPSPMHRDTDAVVHERFNLLASVTLAAEDDLGRERLCRYLMRPAFSLSRFRMRRDGLVTYRVKKLGRRRATHRIQ